MLSYACTFWTRSTTSWMVPLRFPSCDMERRSVSMATWLEHPSSDSPFTDTSWSFTLRRPSWFWKKQNQKKKKVTAGQCVLVEQVTGTRVHVRHIRPICLPSLLLSTSAWIMLHRCVCVCARAFAYDETSVSWWARGQRSTEEANGDSCGWLSGSSS